MRGQFLLLGEKARLRGKLSRVGWTPSKACCLPSDIPPHPNPLPEERGFLDSCSVLPANNNRVIVNIVVKTRTGQSRIKGTDRFQVQTNGAEGQTRTAGTWIFSPMKRVLSCVAECFLVQIKPSSSPWSTADSIEWCAVCVQDVSSSLRFAVGSVTVPSTEIPCLPVLSSTAEFEDAR